MLSVQKTSAFILISILLAGCGGGFQAVSSSSTCTAVAGTAYTPTVSGVASTNHDSSVSITTTETTLTAPVMGLTQAAPASKEVSLTIDMTDDIGAFGSLQIEAETQTMPAGYEGSARPYLVSLHDGTNELINLARTGGGGDCAASGYHTVTGTTLGMNPSCTISQPSAYLDIDTWFQHQYLGGDGLNGQTVNIFPTCSWADGTNGSSTFPECSFTQDFFPVAPARMRFGVNYTAKFLLVSDSYVTTAGTDNGTFKVKVVKKVDTTSGGAFDLNLILVGSQNVADSRTDLGKRNLNTILTTMTSVLAQTNSQVKVGTINVIEYGCAEGGDAYASIDLDDVYTLMQKSGTLVSSATSQHALNVFLVSNINSSGSTVLGYSGAVNGPSSIGTPSSGLIFSTYDELATLNTRCSSSATTCDITTQDELSNIIGSGMAHEIGHFLGLNHPSESAGSSHDAIPDTPICTATAASGAISISSCRVSDTNQLSGQTCSAACPTYTSVGGYCPTALPCIFNYLMYYTNKNFTEVTGAQDGTILSTDSGVKINLHPLVQ